MEWDKISLELDKLRVIEPVLLNPGLVGKNFGADKAFTNVFRYHNRLYYTSESVKGMVVCVNNYIFNGMDVALDDHIKFFKTKNDLLDSVKCHGYASPPVKSIGGFVYRNENLIKEITHVFPINVELK